MSLVAEQSVKDLFLTLKNNQYNIAKSTFKERKAKLLALKVAIESTFRQEIRDALVADFKKPQAETDLSEIFAITTEINHTVKHLEAWMGDQYVSTPLAFLGSSSYVKHEPKGVCLIISPWNFPFNLSFGPLVSAIAAGNTVIIKPSELTPNSSTLIKKIVQSVFPTNEVQVIEGGVEESTELLALPFNHIFFTGSPQVGRIVMQAAAKNLTSVTLELGGKSPTIIDETANIKTISKRLVWGKFLNAGQICIAPDYIYVHESKYDELIQQIKATLKEFYEDNPLESGSYCSIVNDKQAKRIKELLEDAVLCGAIIHEGGQISDRRIAPTLLGNLNSSSRIMKEEIFGPILPILKFSNKEDVVTNILNGEKPLAVYIYSNSKRNIDYFLNNTRAGTTCINNSDMQFLQPYLPFGGDNYSGIGKGHGLWGFKSFSNERSVYRQHIPSLMEKLLPPYNPTKNKLIEWVVKWF